MKVKTEQVKYHELCEPPPSAKVVDACLGNLAEIHSALCTMTGAKQMYRIQMIRDTLRKYQLFEADVKNHNAIRTSDGLWAPQLVDVRGYTAAENEVERLERDLRIAKSEVTDWQLKYEWAYEQAEIARNEKRNAVNAVLGLMLVLLIVMGTVVIPSCL